MKDSVQLSESLADRLDDLLTAEGEMPTKWIAVVEVIGPDGRRWLRTLCPPDAATWDNLGMLSFALNQQQQTQMVTDE